MVHVSGRRQITETEKRAVLERQGLRCFIDNHPVDSEKDLEFDHIEPYSEAGESTPANIGAMCKKHNREKGTLSLSEYRDRVELKRFFEGAKKRRLDDLLDARLATNGYGQQLRAELGPSTATLFLESGPLSTPLARCPATGESYFFATIPFSHIRNDAELQPRALEPERVWELYRHLRTHTQLAPAVCRLVDSEIRLFDGQHKAAAQVWAGRSAIDCKVYVNPEVRRLKETNLSAHDSLRQMPFYTSTLLEKYAGMASEDWESFLLSGGAKTESAFVDFMRSKFGLSRADATKRIRSLIYSNIIEDEQNRPFRDYIMEENRGRQNPITMHRLEKTFFADFICAPPLNDEFETEQYHRDEERQNIVLLLNYIVEHALLNKWAPERNDAMHKKAARLFSAGALRAWVPFLRDAIAAALQLFEQKERSRVFYRTLSQQDSLMVERLVKRLLSHKVWEDPDPNLKDLRYDNADRAKEMLRSAGLTPNWILGGDS